MSDRPFMSDDASVSEPPGRREPTAVGRAPTGSDQPLWDDLPPTWERDLDDLVRPSLFVAPPPDVQHAILAAVLQAAAEVPRPVLAAATPAPMPVPADVAPAGRSISLATYLLLAAVLVAYAAALSWVQSLFGGGGWLPTLLSQILAASELVLGPLPVSEPLALTWLILQRAPWLALLPLAWLLWERDRASAPEGDRSSAPRAA